MIHRRRRCSHDPTALRPVEPLHLKTRPALFNGQRRLYSTMGVDGWKVKEEEMKEMRQALVKLSDIRKEVRG